MARLLAIFFTLLALAANAAPSFTDSTANIAAWNLKGFGGVDPARIPALTNAIALIDAEVIAVVEVAPDFVAAEIVADLNNMDLCYRRVLLDQTSNMNIAVLHKCAVEVTNPRLIPGSDNGSTALRKAFAVDVKVGEFDFIMIAVHMKAGRGSSNRGIRDNQAQAIATFIQAETAGAEKDVLVVGDYNMIPVEDDSNFTAMNPGNFLEFVSSADLAGDFTHISGGAPGNLLDGYAISSQHTVEYIPATLRIWPMHTTLGLSLAQFDANVSDHLPVSAEFVVLVDDD